VSATPVGDLPERHRAAILADRDGEPQQRDDA
jgi:hypothetical protein